MVRGFSHLSDNRLIEVCLAEPLLPREQRHLQQCADCATRRSDLAALLEDVAEAADAETDTAFTPDKLLRQHARILHRVSQDGRPARVISFPGHPSESGPSRSRPRFGWMAGAAAAGLVIGLVAGQMGRDVGPVQTTTLAERTEEAVAPLRTANAAFAEEELLGQIELAVSSSSSALGTLNAMTPRAWEVK